MLSIARYNRAVRYLGICIFVVGCSSGAGGLEPDAGLCSTGDRRPCATSDGCAGNQTCDDGVWQACERIDVDDDVLTCTCSDGATRPCTTGNGQEGGQQCVDGDWGECTAGIAQIAAGGHHTCVRFYSGAVKCWGLNEYGQLGYGHTNDLGDDELVSSFGYVDLGEPAIDVTAGFEHTCAVLNSGAVKCWGHGEDGALGYGNEDNIGDDELPSTVGTVDIGEPIKQVTTGWGHTCAVTVDGGLYCWGSNRFYRKLGYSHADNIGDDESPAVAGRVDIGGNVVSVSSHNHHTCALLDTGGVRCWGGGTGGVLGYGVGIPQGQAPAVSGDIDLGERATRLVVGWFQNCALLESGNARCWGSTLGYPQLQDEVAIGYDSTPASVDHFDAGGEIASIHTGRGINCALMQSGGVRCWGGPATILGYQLPFLDDNGNTNYVGDDETVGSMGDVSVGGTATMISTGGFHVCALLTDGNLRCWGGNEAGQLGYGHSDRVGDDEWPSDAGNVEL